MGKLNYRKFLFLVFIIFFIPLSTQFLAKDKSTTTEFSTEIESFILSDSFMEEQENDSEVELFFNLSLIFPLIFCVFSFILFDSQIKFFQKFSFHQFSIPPPVIL